MIFLEKEAKSCVPVIFSPIKFFGGTWYWHANFSSPQKKLLSGFLLSEMSFPEIRGLLGGQDVHMEAIS